MFQLSLSSKELFHSNFLFWLFENYPNEAGPIFADYLKKAPPTYDSLKVDREQKNIDLWLKYSNGEELIIENKVKSLPIKSQLKKYADNTQNKDKTSFLLLSLTRPAFLKKSESRIQLSEGVEWHYLSYHELANKLQGILPAIRTDKSYHRQILQDYIEFITQLDKLQCYFSIERDMDENFFGREKEIQLLRAIRIHDLIDKLRYDQIAQLVRKVLQEENFAIIDDDIWSTGKPGQLTVGAGMSRGTAMVEIMYCLTDAHVILGVQVQGKQFRLVLRADREAEKLAQELLMPTVGNRVWFDFEKLDIGGPEHPDNGNFNKYGNNFLYRWKKLDSISSQSLVDKIVKYSRIIRDNEMLLSQLLKTIK